jgi:hypothetical protein
MVVGTHHGRAATQDIQNFLSGGFDWERDGAVINSEGAQG